MQIIATDRQVAKPAAKHLPKLTKAMLRVLHKEHGSVVDRNSKIDASVYSTNPLKCVRGAVLAKIPDTVCHDCYAIKAFNQYPSVRESQDGNQLKYEFARDNNNLEDWAQSMAWQIQDSSDRKEKAGKLGAGLHRWFGAGDCPDVDFILAVVRVCELTPNIRHWLPTREYSMVEKAGLLPQNLVIRVSSNYIDKAAPSKFKNTSTVNKNAPAIGYTCPASANDSCGEHNCTACWDSNVENVSYPFH